ncbi:hypothetical protein Y032_0797g2401, partial [Ancylostoma ceylanicum]|uniref:Peptidase M13 N-terminal domain-containing protein n=1 Tax=Ancylostoma ceylanicum TaxID=53326 RepID=A0A016WDJ7_9BILA
MLESKEFGDSRAMTSAQRFHEKCVSSDEEWKSKGGSINFVMRNIRRYGYFPLINGMPWEEQSFDLTMLLAYFNRNKTVNPALVPEIVEHILYPSQLVATFHHRYDVLIYKMATSSDPSTSEAAFQLLLNFVNWTKYLHLVCPPDAHRCISSDSVIREDNPEVMARIHLLLKNTTERVITNYVMLLYALSWADFLDEDYRSIISFFAKKLNVPVYTKNEFSSHRTWYLYGHAMMAMYARKNSGRETKEAVTALSNEIFQAFKDVIGENKWIDKKSKQVAIVH